MKEFKAGLCLFVLAGIFFLGSSVAWRGVQGFRVWTICGRVMMFVAGATLLFFSYRFIVRQKGNEPWSRFFDSIPITSANEPLTYQVYRPFLTTYSRFKKQLGDPIADVQSNSNSVYQASHVNALVLWLETERTIYALPSSAETTDLFPKPKSIHPKGHGRTMTQ